MELNVQVARRSEPPVIQHLSDNLPLSLALSLARPHSLSPPQAVPERLVCRPDMPSLPIFFSSALLHWLPCVSRASWQLCVCVVVWVFGGVLASQRGSVSSSPV